MIDTIKFKIPLSPHLLSKIKEHDLSSTVKTGRDGEVKETLSDALLVEPYSSFIYPYIIDKGVVGTLFIEFSVPKLVWGNNIFLFYPEGLEEVLFNIQLSFEEKYGISLPDFQTWIVQRLDICYVWMFESNTLAHDVLTSFRTFEYPRKDEYAYSTTIGWKGDSFSVKFYLKKEEFERKDYKIKKNVNDIFAGELLATAEGSLRFEVEYKKAKLNSYFQNNELVVGDINNRELFIKILEEELKKMLKGFKPEIIEDRVILEKILSTHGDKLGFHLSTFYLSIFRVRSLTLLRSIFPKSRINRYYKQLAGARVGLICRNKNIKVELVIPSDLAPNQMNDQVALATDHDEFVPVQQVLIPIQEHFDDV